MSDCINDTCQDCVTPTTGEPVCGPSPTYTNNVCPDTPLSDCVLYNGDDNDCIGIKKGSFLTSVVKSIISYISTIIGKISSTSLLVNRSGACNDNLTIEIVPSSDINNGFVLGTDNKPFVAKQDILVNNSTCITFQKSVSGSVITFVPTIDFACIASKVCPTCQGTAVPCVAVTGLSVGTITTTSGIISFTTTGATSYDILVNNVLSQAGISSPFTLTGLTPNTSYSITIRSNCPSSTTAEATIIFTTLPILSCNTPSNIQIQLS